MIHHFIPVFCRAWDNLKWVLIQEINVFVNVNLVLPIHQLVALVGNDTEKNFKENTQIIFH